MFGPLLNSFCQDFSFTISDEVRLPKKSFKYVSDAHNACSIVCLPGKSTPQQLK